MSPSWILAPNPISGAKLTKTLGKRRKIVRGASRINISGRHHFGSLFQDDIFKIPSWFGVPKRVPSWIFKLTPSGTQNRDFPYVFLKKSGGGVPKNKLTWGRFWSSYWTPFLKYPLGLGSQNRSHLEYLNRYPPGRKNVLFPLVFLKKSREGFPQK